MAPATRAGEFFFHDGDRPVVFLGDSITAQQKYTTYLETFVLSRYPHWNITFRNLGLGGDTMWLRNRGGVAAGLQRDVLPLHPQSITIGFGMNDAVFGDPYYPIYVHWATNMVQQLQAAGVRVALLTSSPREGYETNQPAGSTDNRMLWKYALGLQQVAKQERVPWVDQYTPFVSLIENGRQAGVLSATNSEQRLIPGGIHPNWAGHLVMAATILKGLSASAIVSRAEIDAQAAKVLAAEGCQVELLPAAGGTLVFRRTDQSLPWFIPVDGRLALQLPGFAPLEDLSRYVLRVTNLTAPRYKLTIDDVVAGTFPNATLAAGVNLSLQAGPITAQAEQLFNSVLKKNDLFSQRWWHQLNDKATENQRQTELSRLDAEIARAEQGIHELRQPVPHLFKLIPVE